MVYMGSKRRMLPVILPVINKVIEDMEPVKYIEPFVGGANVITEVSHPERIGSDSSRDLIDFLRFCRDEPDMGWCPEDITKEDYIAVRTDFRNGGMNYDRKTHLAVGWLGSFGGKFYNGGFGSHNDPKRDSVYKECKRHMILHAPKLKGIGLECRDYRKYTADKYKGCLFYLDPPYHGTEKYSDQNFKYEEFVGWCREMAKENWLLVSEYDMPGDFKMVAEREVKTIIASQRERYKAATERLYYIGKDGWK